VDLAVNKLMSRGTGKEKLKNKTGGQSSSGGRKKTLREHDSELKERLLTEGRSLGEKDKSEGKGKKFSVGIFSLASRRGERVKGA